MPSALPFRRVSLLLPIALAATTVFAQASAPVAPKPGTEGAQKSAQRNAETQTGTPKPAPSDADTHLTKAQADDLLASVDGILAFVSKDTHLANNKPIKRAIHTRAEVTEILRRKMAEDEGTRRMQRAELVLKKFGLLDRDFDLQPFLLSLLSEQVAGFYEPKTRTMNLLDWVKPDEQKPVIAHELTHALQDNRVGLEKWNDPQPEEMSHNEREDNLHIQTDEASTARQAVTEGQAMVTFIDYSIRDTGKTLRDVPQMGDRLAQMGSDTSGSPILARAPLVLQQSLLFPYTNGVTFEQAILQRNGVDAAFAGALDRPPSSSHEILHPDDYLNHVPVPVLAIPDIHPLLDKQWNAYDIGVMGELDVRMLTELFGGAQIAGPLSLNWDGGIYYAAQKKDVTPAQKASTASLGLLYLSRWKNADSARSFLRVYATQLPRKYEHLQQVTTGTDVDIDHLRFTSEEGDILLTLDDRTVFISEGFPLDLAKQLEAKLREVQGNGVLQNAGLSNQLPVAGELHNRLATVVNIVPLSLR
ncbi:hypothetical protein [Terriglobus aquaticus]|uniref:Uncharacterized protein n=1 Tax=Terriglobus aquaticus TaxID=940139 RepID=A0ABW9KGV0_9BACT|nr:hypothetical protein [Terriglobus aquaticus]